MSIAIENEYLAALGRLTTATDDDRALLALLTPGVEQAIAKELGNGDPVDIEQTSRTFILPERDRNEELFDVDNLFYQRSGNRVYEVTRGRTRYLQVPAVALRSVEDLREDTGGLFAASTALTEGRDQDFYLDETESGISRTAMLVRVGTSWPGSRRTVQVQCTVGFTEAELAGRYSDIKLAALETMVKTFEEWRTQQSSSGGGSGPVISRRLGDSMWTFSEAAQETLKNMQVTLPSSAQRKLTNYRLVRYL